MVLSQLDNSEPQLIYSESANYIQINRRISAQFNTLGFGNRDLPTEHLSPKITR
jgi:hypothetical protein